MIRVLGAGALGSHAVQFLRNVKVPISVVDFDHVESHNTMSQFHGVGSLRKNKTAALQQLMNFLFKRKIETFPVRLTKDNLIQLLGTADSTTVVVDCFDNADSRTLIQDYVRKNKIPCIHGGTAADGSFARVMWDETFVIDRESSTGQATCENGEFLPFLGITGAYLAKAILEFIETGKKSNYQIHPNGVMKL